MPPKKDQKLSLSQRSVKDAPAVSSSPFDTVLPKDLHPKILSFLLAKPIPAKPTHIWAEKVRPYDAVRDDHHNLVLVSKQWKAVVGDLVNEGAPRDIITPRELAELKSKVFALDLSTNESIHKMFISLFKMKYPTRLDYNEYDDGEIEFFNPEPWWTVPNFFARVPFALPFPFATMVEEEYKRFLVHKCIQILATRKNAREVTTSGMMWAEPVVPCELVDLFWQSHALCTTKYVNDCHSLIDEVIEYQQLYHGDDEDDDNSGPEETCSVSQRHGLLFRFEQYFLKPNHVCSGDNHFRGQEPCRVPIGTKDRRGKWPRSQLATRDWLFAPRIDIMEIQNILLDSGVNELGNCHPDKNCCSFCCLENEFQAHFGSEEVEGL